MNQHVIPRKLWQLAGGLALAHVVLLLAGIALQDSALFADGTAGIREAYVEGSLSRTLTGLGVESLGFLAMVPVVVFLGRALGRRTESGRWAAQTGLACGVGYVVVTFAVGFPAGAASMYGAQHGLDVDTAFAINNVRIFSYFLSLALLGVNTLVVAALARAEDLAPRLVGWGGLATGALLVAAPALAPLGLQDVATLVWIVWWVALAVVMLRRREETALRSEVTAADSALLRHA
jgi:hypothetical protein